MVRADSAAPAAYAGAVAAWIDFRINASMSRVNGDVYRARVGR